MRRVGNLAERVVVADPRRKADERYCAERVRPDRQGMKLDCNGKDGEVDAAGQPVAGLNPEHAVHAQISRPEGLLEKFLDVDVGFFGAVELKQLCRLEA